MSDRQQILAWFEHSAVTDAKKALHVAGVLPTAGDWRVFLDRLLLWSGATALAAAMVFFIAHNWGNLGKFAKFGLVALPLILTVIGYSRLGVDRAAGKASLLVASILLGVLLALFGQTYQTGADTWQLFANWAALMAPWVLIGRFSGLWILWVAITNTAIVFYFRTMPGAFGILFSPERQLWTLFVFNSIILICWELAATRISWLNERWACRLLAIGSGTTVTLLMIYAIFDWQDSSIAPLIAYPTWLACAYFAYRLRICDVFVLAGGCLSVIVVMTSFLTRHLLDSRFGAGAWLFIALAIIGISAASGYWLKQVANERTA